MTDHLVNWVRAHPRVTIIICVTGLAYLTILTTLFWLYLTFPGHKYATTVEPPLSYIPGGSDCQTSRLVKLSPEAREKQQDKCNQFAWTAYHEEVQAVTALRQASNSDTQTKTQLLDSVILFATLIPTAIGLLTSALPAPAKPGEKREQSTEPIPIRRPRFKAKK